MRKGKEEEEEDGGQGDPASRLKECRWIFQASLLLLLGSNALAIKAMFWIGICLCFFFLQAEGEGCSGGPSGGAGSGPVEDQDDGRRARNRPGQARRGESKKSELSLYFILSQISQKGT